MNTKFILALVLLSLFAIVAIKAQSEEQTEADAAIEQLAETMADQIVDSLMADSLVAPETKCVNAADGLNVRDALGNLKRTLANNSRVTTNGAVKQMRGETFVSIGNNEWVAQRFLKNCAATPAPTSAPKPVPTPSTPATGGNDKVQVSLKKIFGHEGKCQNWKSDSGNSFNGRIGYTCNGITPSVAYNNRNGAFSFASNFDGHPADFCKYAYDKSPAQFGAGAAQVYTTQYAGPGGCTNLPMPSYYVCFDIAVNSGPGRSKQYLAELGPLKKGGDGKDYARKLNEKHRQDYIKWSASGPNTAFRQGWLRRAADRDAFINSYRE